MAESVMFNSPFILLCLIAAAGFCICEIVTKASGFWLPVLSGVFFTAALIILLLKGGTLQEALIISLIFFLINASIFCAKENCE